MPIPPFTNDFEEGDFSAWTGTTITGGCTCEVQHSNVHHNLHSEHSVLAAWTNNAYCYKTLDNPITTLYIRGYTYFTTAPTSGNYALTVFCESAATGAKNGVGFKNDAGTNKFCMRWSSDAAVTVDVVALPALSLNTWYCLEFLGVIAAGSAGIYRGYIDGTEYFTHTGVDNDGLTRWVYGETGLYTNTGSGAPVAYIDCVKMATVGPIGTEGAPPGVTVKKGSNLAGTMATMLNSKMLFSYLPRRVI